MFTNNPFQADEFNFYKIEKCNKDGSKVDCMPYTGKSLEVARKIFSEAIKNRPRIRLTIRQRRSMLEQWPAPG
jgi:hypothetical protein